VGTGGQSVAARRKRQKIKQSAYRCESWQAKWFNARKVHQFDVDIQGFAAAPLVESNIMPDGRDFTASGLLPAGTAI